jgi:ParB/Sulfiredoxin domain
VAKPSASAVVQPEAVPVGDLHFDAKNPRLLEHDASDRQLLLLMWRDFAVEEVALSIAANGFWSYEPLVAIKEDGRAVVIEGNRRLAAVKLLLDENERNRVGATGLPKISQERREELQTLPVIYSTRHEAWRYIGFKHVNGPQAWQSYSKAQYIAWVHNELGVPLDKVAETIGDTHSTVQRLYRALMTLEQAERRGLWSREDRFKDHFSFSHLFIGINSYSGIQRYLGLDGPPLDTPDPIPESHLDELRNLLIWLYGSRSGSISPVVQSQNPHLRQLDQVLASPNAIAAIQSGLPLSVALDVAKGDEAKLREDLVAARRLLQDSRGKVLTGYKGERDLLEVADEIVLLAEAVVDDMRAVDRRMRSARRVSR